MDKEVAELLRELATQLGTTTEYLWGVTIKQAVVSAVTSIIFMLSTTVFGFVLYKLNKKFGTKRTKDGYTQTLYDEFEVVLAVPMIIGAILFAIMLLGSFLDIHNIVTAIFNPEYWALDNILDKLNPSK